jgi:MFS family permease
MAIVTMAQTAEFNPVLGVFLKPMTTEFGWSRAQFAGAITVGTMAGGLTAIAIGPLLDRYGPRWILSIAFLFLGASVAGLAVINNLWHFYALMATSRLLVSGVISIATGVVISKWFIRRRGRAMAFSTTGTRFGNALMPLYVQLILGGFGWRAAAIALGVLTWVLTLAPTAIFLRRQPEDMGLLPDGDEPGETMNSSGSGLQENQTSDVSFTPGEVARTRSFYIVLLVTGAMFFTGAGVNFNLFPYLTDNGISPTAAVTVITVWAIVGSVGGLAAGFIAEKVHVRLVMAVCFFFVALGVAVLSVADNLGTAYLFALVHGVAFGAIPILSQLVWADYFGRRHQGAIRGMVTPFQMLANSLAPLLTNVLYAALDNSYVPIFRAFVLVYLAAAFAMLIAAPPVSHRPVSDSA